jgi:hypothetical protein
MKFGAVPRTLAGTRRTAKGHISRLVNPSVMRNPLTLTLSQREREQLNWIVNKPMAEDSPTDRGQSSLSLWERVGVRGI